MQIDIDWLNFSPWSALGGGALIGLASAFLLLASGRIAGVSGIVGSLLRAQSGSADWQWQLAFTLGLLAAPPLWSRLVPGGFPVQRLQIGALEQFLPFALGGVLVGIGTRLANGCTSGHGVCGLARFSRRSLVAVIVFMGTAMAVVFITRHLAGGA